MPDETSLRRFLQRLSPQAIRQLVCFHVGRAEIVAVRSSPKNETCWIMILWVKEFETGIEKLDQQHRLLVDNINMLEEQLPTTNPTREELEFTVHLVDYLDAYANIHYKARRSAWKVTAVRPLCIISRNMKVSEYLFMITEGFVRSKASKWN